MIYSHKIILKDIKANVHIGVTESERRKKQKVLITVEVVPSKDSLPKNDKIEETVNYSYIREEVLTILKNRRFNLIETLCREIAEMIKNNFNVAEVSITVKKFPYKDVKYVSYSLTI